MGSLGSRRKVERWGNACEGLLELSLTSLKSGVEWGFQSRGG